MADSITHERLRALWQAHRERRLPRADPHDPRQLALHATLAGEDSAVAGLVSTALGGGAVTRTVAIGHDPDDSPFGQAVEDYRAALRALLAEVSAARPR